MTSFFFSHLLPIFHPFPVLKNFSFTDYQSFRKNSRICLNPVNKKGTTINCTGNGFPLHTHCGLGAVTKFCSFVRNNSWDISLLWRREPAWVYRANQKAVLSPSLPRRILVHRVINSSRPRDITRLRGGIHRMVSSHHWKKEKTLLIMVMGPSGVQFCV